MPLGLERRGHPTGVTVVAALPFSATLFASGALFDHPSGHSAAPAGSLAPVPPPPPSPISPSIVRETPHFPKKFKPDNGAYQVRFWM